jgi:kinesin family protein C2/C3
MWQSGPSGGTSKDMGINYLALNDLFQMSNERKDNIKYDIYVQMVEIYNEQVRDLLAEDKTENKYPFSYSLLFSRVRNIFMLLF